MSSAENVIRFHCTQCKRTLKAAAQQVGLKVRCPTCKARQQVPQPESSSSAGDDEYRLLPGVDQPAPDSEIAYGRYIPFACPLCHAQIQAREDQVGEKIDCPDCLLPVVVPPRPAEVIKKHLAPPTDIYGLSERSWNEEEPPSIKRIFTIKCPLCHSQMDASEDQVGEAIRCPDCQTKVMVRLPVPKKRFELPANFSDEMQLGATFERPPVELPPSHSVVDRNSASRGDGEMVEIYAGSKERIRIRAPEDSELPSWPLVRGVFTFPFYPGVLGRWVIFSGTIIAIGAVLAFAASFGLIGMVFTAALSPLVIMWLVAVSARMTTIVQETASGIDVIDEWPDAQFLDWVGELFYSVNSIVLGFLPGVMLSLFFANSEIAQAACVFGSLFIFFPIFLLSTMEAASAFMPISGPIYSSLLRAWWAWLAFYVEAALLAAAVTGVCWAAIEYMGLWAVVPIVIVCMGAMFIYFRLLGRLAWYCAPDEEEEAGEDGTDRDRSSGEMDHLNRMMIA